MDLNGKLVDQVNIKTRGDIFYEILRDKPQNIATMTPEKIHGCDLHAGEFGTVGSEICWDYTQDGKRKYGKERIEAIDEENKTIIFRFIEGDLLDLYKSFIITYHVDDTGEDNHLVTLTFEYEKLNEDIPDPNALMEYFLEALKDMEAHHLATPSL